MCCIEFKKLLPAYSPETLLHNSITAAQFRGNGHWATPPPRQDIGWGSFSKNPACSVLSGVKEMVEAAGIEAEQVT